MRNPTWLIDGFVVLQLARGGLLAGGPGISNSSVGSPELSGFSTILSGTSIELFQNHDFLSIFANLSMVQIVSDGGTH
jgi:hypothetical protein